MLLDRVKISLVFSRVSDDVIELAIEVLAARFGDGEGTRFGGEGRRDGRVRQRGAQGEW
jgi:hypothetical protein